MGSEMCIRDRKILDLAGANSPEVAELSKSIGVSQKAIEELFGELEKVSTEHSELEAELARKLAEIS